MSAGAGGTPSSETLRAALRAIVDPASGRDIVAAGLIEGIEVRDGLVQVALLTDRAHAAKMEPVRKAAEVLLARQPGVVNAAVVLTAQKSAQATATPQQGGRSRPGRSRAGTNMGDTSMVGTSMVDRARRRRCCCRM